MTPTVPTMAESGYPDVEAVAWHGIFVPARTPQDVVDKLNAEIVKALTNPEIKDLLSKQAMSPVGSTQADFAAFLKTAGVPFLETEREGERTNFVFEKQDNIRDLKNGFFTRTAKVYFSDGSLFGDELLGFERLNFACPRSLLAEALGRVERAVRIWRSDR